MLCCYWSLLVHSARTTGMPGFGGALEQMFTMVEVYPASCNRMQSLFHEHRAPFLCQLDRQRRTSPQSSAKAPVCFSISFSFRSHQRMRKQSKHAKLMAKRPNSRLGFEAVLFEVTDLRPTLWREPLTGSSKIFKNKVFESLQKWLDRVSQIFLTVSIRRSVLDCDILRCHDVQMRPVSCRDCGACSACNAPGPSAEPSAPGSEGRPNDPGSCWGSCAASDVSKASLTFLRHLTWTQHSCQWLGSVGDLPMLLHNSVPFEASLSVVWIAWELWSVSM